MPDAEEQRNLYAQEELYALVADLEAEMNEPPWTDRVALIIDAKVGYRHAEVFSKILLNKWDREIVPTKVLVLRTLADRLEAEWADQQPGAAGLLTALFNKWALEDEAIEVQDRIAFWNRYTGEN